MKNKLIFFSQKLKNDYTLNCVGLDNYLEKEIDQDQFEKVYDKIQQIKKSSKTAYNKLYAYFYFHYC